MEDSPTVIKRLSRSVISTGNDKNTSGNVALIAHVKPAISNSSRSCPYSSHLPPTIYLGESGDMKREMRIRELNRDLLLGNKCLKELKLKPVDYLLFPCKHSIGSTLQTLFGTGTVVNFRSDDGIYEIEVDNLKIYLPLLSIST